MTDPEAIFPASDLEWTIDFEKDYVRLQVDGNDVVSLQVSDDGTAFVIVHASSHPDADTARLGNINIREHLTNPPGGLA